LALCERTGTTEGVSMGGLLSGDAVVAGTCRLGLRDYTDEILAGGFPGMRGLTGRALVAQLDSYLDRIVDHDHAVRGAPDRPADPRPPAGMAADPRPPVGADRGPQAPPGRPGLAARLVRVGASTLLTGASPDAPIPRDGTYLGALFESLAILSVRTLAQRNDARVHHLRTRGGRHEIDMVVEGDDGFVAIEVKLAAAVEERDVAHLRWLRAQVPDRFTDLVVLSQ
jgi:hypothetical protein